MAAQKNYGALLFKAKDTGNTEVKKVLDAIVREGMFWDWISGIQETGYPITVEQFNHAASIFEGNGISKEVIAQGRKMLELHD